MTPAEMDRLTPSNQRILGISCTAAAIAEPEWVRSHPALKVIIHRDFREINDSLHSIGFPSIDHDKWRFALDRIAGIHVGYETLFRAKAARRVWEGLGLGPFDEERHALLTGFNVQPDFDVMQWRPYIGRRLMAEAEIGHTSRMVGNDPHLQTT